MWTHLSPSAGECHLLPWSLLTSRMWRQNYSLIWSISLKKFCNGKKFQNQFIQFWKLLDPHSLFRSAGIVYILLFSLFKWFFFGVFVQKLGMAGSTILKLSTKRIQVFWRKKLRKWKLLASLWIVILNKQQLFATIFQAPISNILKYFLSETIHAQ